MGIGLNYIGERDISAVGKLPAGDDYIEFNTVRFVCYFWLPIIPIGCYRIRRIRRNNVIDRIVRNVWHKETIYEIQKLPFNWKQALLIWVLGCGWYFWYVFWLATILMLAKILQR